MRDMSPGYGQVFDPIRRVDLLPLYTTLVAQFTLALVESLLLPYRPQRA